MTFIYITLSSLCKRLGELKAEAQLRVQWKWIGKERCEKKDVKRKWTGMFYT